MARRRGQRGRRAHPTCTVALRADTEDALVTNIAVLAVAFDFEVTAPPELITRLGQIARRLEPAGGGGGRS